MISEQERFEQTVWLFYIAVRSALKHDFDIIDLSKANAMNGRGELYKTFGNTGFQYLWKDLEIVSFPDFMDKKTYYGFDWFTVLYNKRGA